MASCRCAASQGPGLAFRGLPTLALTSLDFSSPLAFQWLNQSHNACVNYANRNATKVSADGGAPALVARSSSLRCRLTLPYSPELALPCSMPSCEQPALQEGQ